MEIKLIDHPEWKRSALIWFIFSAIQFLGAYYYQSFFFLLAGIFALATGIQLFTKMTDLTYLTLRNEILTIHLRRFPFGKKNIHLQEIDKVEVIFEKEILFRLKNGQKIKLRKDWISYDDFLKMKQKLEGYTSVTFH